MTDTRRRVVVVSGPPGAGKSTLARPLATALDLPLLTKDLLKEALHDALGPLDDDPVVTSRRLGGAAMELLWRLAAACPAVVIEANFHTGSADQRERLRSLCPRPVEVHLRVPDAVARERFRARAGTGARHRVHVVEDLRDEVLDASREPFGLGAVIAVDAAAPLDVRSLAAQVTAELGAADDLDLAVPTGDALRRR